MSLIELAVEHANESIVITDCEGRIQYVNPAFERSSGYSREALIGETPRLMKSGLENESFYRELWEAILRGEVWSNCIFNKRKDGTLFVEHMTISPIRDSSGELVSFVAVKRDVTRERALEFQLQQAQHYRPVGVLGSGLAHELSTPSQFVGDYLRFLEEAFHSVSAQLSTHAELESFARKAGIASEIVEKLEQQREALDLVPVLEDVPGALKGALDGIERIAVIARAMKDFSQPDAEDKTAADLNQILATTVEIARNEWKYVANVATDFDPDLPVVPGHPAELKEVFLNLIVNAAEAIQAAGKEDKGAIGVRTRVDGDWLEVSVSDTGVGLLPGMEERVFEPYFTSKEVDKGTGQGLAIAQSFIVEQHGGTIHCESELGKGSRFIVRLPIAPPTSDGEA